MADLTSDHTDPKLDRPGAGIPAAEARFMRIIGLGLVSPRVSWNLARRWFIREGETILRITENLTEDRLTRRVLIPRVPGIEDSSRYWSPAMTLRHLIMAGDIEADIISRLSRGEPIETAVRIEDLKPEAQPSRMILEDYRALLVRFDNRVGREVDNRRSRVRHAHPWLGPLTAHHWLFLAAVHQRQHRKQIRSILRHGAATS
jgi:uncharacterized damage-inducible protein DinB